MTTAVRCTKRPNRRPCDGFVMVFRHPNGEIAWGCDVCGDEGVIVGWHGSPTDVSGLDDGDVDGDEITAVVSREVFDAVRGVLLLDAACELVVGNVGRGVVGGSGRGVRGTRRLRCGGVERRVRPASGAAAR